MPHHTPQTASARRLPSDWHDMLATGDIIRWPLGGGPEGLALVVEIGAIAGSRVLSVAPGLVERCQPVRTGTLRLSESEARHSGLPCRMRFELDLRISLAATHRALSYAQGSPVIGRLSKSPLERLNAQSACIHALRDIAAARRKERRAQPRGDRRTDWRIAAGMVRPQAAQEGRQ